jgi:hypothetical protein
MRLKHPGPWLLEFRGSAGQASLIPGNRAWTSGTESHRERLIFRKTRGPEVAVETPGGDAPAEVPRSAKRPRRGPGRIPESCKTPFHRAAESQRYPDGRNELIQLPAHAPATAPWVAGSVVRKWGEWRRMEMLRLAFGPNLRPPRKGRPPHRSVSGSRAIISSFASFTSSVLTDWVKI